MSQVDSKELIEFIEKLPGFSAVVMKIVSLSNNPKTTATDLVTTISMDPLLTAKLLKLVNSAFYGPSKGIASLNRAVIMLGFNTVKNMSLSVAVVNSIGIKKDFKWFTNEQFWEHNLGCAIAARSMAKAMKANPLEVEEFFVAGLLHDMGRAVLIQKFTGECEILYDPDTEPGVGRHKLEKDAFTLSHAELGGIVAERWKFPSALSSAIEFHHNPLASQDESRQLALTVYMADHYSHIKKIGIQNSVNAGTISGEVWDAFGLSEEEVESCLADLAENVEEAKAFLSNVE